MSQKEKYKQVQHFDAADDDDDDDDHVDLNDTETKTSSKASNLSTFLKRDSKKKKQEYQHVDLQNDDLEEHDDKAHGNTTTSADEYTHDMNQSHHSSNHSYNSSRNSPNSKRKPFSMDTNEVSQSTQNDFDSDEDFYDDEDDDLSLHRYSFHESPHGKAVAPPTTSPKSYSFSPSYHPRRTKTKFKFSSYYSLRSQSRQKNERTLRLMCCLCSSISNIVFQIKLKRELSRQRHAERALALSGTKYGNYRIFLETWCDLWSNPGFFLIVSLIGIFILTYRLSVRENGGSKWFLAVGITLVLLRFLWWPIYWFLWGRHVAKKRRSTLAVYDGLNGEAGTSGFKIPSSGIFASSSYGDDNHDDDYGEYEEVGFS